MSVCAARSVPLTTPTGHVRVSSGNVVSQRRQRGRGSGTGGRVSTGRLLREPTVQMKTGRTAGMVRRIAAAASGQCEIVYGASGPVDALVKAFYDAKQLSSGADFFFRTGAVIENGSDKVAGRLPRAMWRILRLKIG